MSDNQPAPPENTAAKMEKVVALLKECRFDEARAICEQLLQDNTSAVDAIYALGWIELCQKNKRSAAEAFKRVIDLKPDHSRAHNNFGFILMDSSDASGAVKHFETAIALEPTLREAHANLGAAFINLGDFEKAKEVFQKAVHLLPDDHEMLANLAAIKNLMGQKNDAISEYQLLISLAPNMIQAHVGLGNALRDQGRLEEALESFQRAYEIDPDFPYLRGDLLWLKMNHCDWRSFDQEVETIVKQVKAGNRAIRPFGLMGLSDSPWDQLTCARTYGMDLFPPAPRPVWQGECYDHDRIKVAYLSADFRRHPMAYLMSGLLEQHDRSRFEIFGLSFGSHRDSSYRSRLENAVDRFIEVGEKSDREIAKLMRELEIDIAVDRKGYTHGSRTGVFALRPAPVQVNYLAYPGSMGVDYFDYIIADRTVITDASRDGFSEKVIYLPHTYQPNDSGRPVSGETPSRSEVGLPESGFVFCSFNASWKIAPRVFDMWMRILQRTEGSVLWLWDRIDTTTRNLRSEAERRGVSPDRLVFAPTIDNSLHLARLRLADLSLDTSPYGAHTTASDSLYSGVPVVTCLGQTFASRVTGSLLQAVGLPELITETFEDFENLAVRLAQDESALGDIKAKLIRNIKSYPLYDTNLYRRHLEAAYEYMWAQYQRGEGPADHLISALG